MLGVIAASRFAFPGLKTPPLGGNTTPAPRREAHAPTRLRAPGPNTVLALTHDKPVGRAANRARARVRDAPTVA